METRTAFVTGAARGLGKAVAETLARDGFALYLADVLADRLEQTAADLRAAGTDVVTRVLDVSRRSDCITAIDDCVARSGRLDVLVNCAGVLAFNHLVDIDEDEWNRLIGVNLSGPLWLCQAALPHLIASKGNIVNVGSSNGVNGTPYTATYSATKAALINLTKTMAMEYMDDPVRINCVCPGPMTTEIGVGVVHRPTMATDKVLRYSGQRGASDVREVADVIAFVASDAGSAVHGAIWMVDTGVSAG